jgi:hypothetical protein
MNFLVIEYIKSSAINLTGTNTTSVAEVLDIND